MPHMHVPNQPTKIQVPRLRYLDSGASFELAQMYFTQSLPKLVNGKPHLGRSGRMKKCLNSPLYIQLI